MLCCVLDSLHMLHRKLNGKSEQKKIRKKSIILFRNERTASGKNMKFFTMQIRTEAIMRPWAKSFLVSFCVIPKVDSFLANLQKLIEWFEFFFWLPLRRSINIKTCMLWQFSILAKPNLKWLNALYAWFITQSRILFRALFFPHICTAAFNW